VSADFAHFPLQARTSQADAEAARARAFAAYKDFLTLWEDADSENPRPEAGQGGVANLQ
jgi:hypothetical protein